ncbi:MAG: coenzyme F420-0:L-glutamate ligase [Micromonosporaceae bacterium]|nr:coenzyme F420-0:L-glutamate ligase [Micromonosporaceae bacterium]
MSNLQIMPITGIGEIRRGDDLAGLITTAAPWLISGDVVVVTSKIVSKADGRVVHLPPPGPQRVAATAAALAAETARVVATRGTTTIVQTRHGFVMASAGIDASNTDQSTLVLLPEDPDASARSLRADIRERCGKDVAVIMTDTMGRPWRAGLVDVALGVAGIDPLLDYRGQRDWQGNELRVTVTAVADELAAAADLVKGKLSRVPVAVIRGWSPASPAAEPRPDKPGPSSPGPDGPRPDGPRPDGPRPDGPRPDGPGGRALIRPAAEDLFSLGTAEARASGIAEGLRLAARRARCGHGRAARRRPA